MTRADNGDWTLAVIIPVHEGVAAEHLALALASMTSQTLQPDEILILEDGELPRSLQATLDQVSSPVPVRRIPLAKGGIAVALQAGLHATSCTWVARMDSDDIAEPNRLAAQMAAVRAGNYDVLGTAVAEFQGHPDRATAVRRMPQDHVAIARMMRWANPINHPTVVLRRSVALAAGGYHPLDGLEDYDLWARMLVAGAVFHNLPDTYLRFRAGPTMLQRRRALPVMLAELRLQRNLYQYGLVGRCQSAANLILRTGFRLLPSQVMRRVYEMVFHRLVGRYR